MSEWLQTWNGFEAWSPVLDAILLNIYILAVLTFYIRWRRRNR